MTTHTNTQADTQADTQAGTQTDTQTNPQPEVLLTGATGFLGGHILHELAQHNIQASALVRTVAGASGLTGSPILVQGSPLDSSDVLNAQQTGIKGIKTIIHTAAVVKHSRTVPPDLYPLNVEGTLNMVRLAKDAGARLIFVSTSGTVGCFKYSDVAADEHALYAEDIVGRWPYYASKIKAEKEARKLAAKLGVELIIVRPPVLLGPGDHRFRSSNHVLGMMRGHVPLVPRGGMHFADVRDVAAAVVRLSQLANPQEVYHLPGSAMSLRNFFHMLGEVTGATPPERTVPPVVLQGVAKLAHTAFGVAHAKAPSWIPDPVVTEMASHYWGLTTLWAHEDLGYTSRNPRQTLVDSADWLRANHPYFKGGSAH